MNSVVKFNETLADFYAILSKLTFIHLAHTLLKTRAAKAK